MRDGLVTATICLLLSACASHSVAPVTYQETVSVQSVLPVHVRLNAYNLPGQPTTTIQFAGPRVAPIRANSTSTTGFGVDEQSMFVDSLKSELVRHGIFGSVSENAGKGVVELDIYFPDMDNRAQSSDVRLSAAMIARYRGQVAFYRYDVMSPDGKRAAASNLLNQVMADVQAFIDDQQISLRTGVKDTRLNIERMLVKW